MDLTENQIEVQRDDKGGYTKQEWVPDVARDTIQSQYWRLNNLYKIKDDDGNVIDFKMKPQQADLFLNCHTRNVILKGRQIGFSTLIALWMLDEALFNDHFTGFIVDRSENEARKKLLKIKFAYENLNIVVLRSPCGQYTHSIDVQKMVGWIPRALDIQFSNGSEVAAGVSPRGGTVQMLHVSEMGKIAAKYPKKAEEIITGALPAVPKNGLIFIESTAEGKNIFHDFYYEGKDTALNVPNPTKLEFISHFYPWQDDYPRCSLDVEEGRILTFKPSLKKYFKTLEQEHGIHLKPGQKLWYQMTEKVQKHKMTQEFPSVDHEAFEAPVEGAYFTDQLYTMKQTGKIGKYDWNPLFPVYTAWDLGYSDYTCVWFFQKIGEEVFLIDFYKDNMKMFDMYFTDIKEKCEEMGYQIEMHFFPHDLKQKYNTVGEQRVDWLSNRNIPFEIMERQAITEMIDMAGRLLDACKIDEGRCKKGILDLQKTTRKWNESTQQWDQKPAKSDYRHGFDAFLYVALSINVRIDPMFENKRALTNNPLFDDNIGDNKKLSHVDKVIRRSGMLGMSGVKVYDSESGKDQEYKDAISYFR